ncbi:MAG TPA: hypothetical protein VGS97_23830 [Actinocrinis sp.]|uniref:hypothetical protein n=1 Tax=Actinocrinis sp. TaxID=1920516 RepID=UPI002DDC921F|nr:hypothetical protein [Actinocrinis sp.]HEV2347148.1 hypothetical protein [Actinocrinis sp.]
MTAAYRAASLSVLGKWLAEAGEGQRWRLVAEFLEEYRHEPEQDRLMLLGPEPLSTGDERWDVFLAGLAEYLAARADRAAPAWAERRSLRRFWFPFGSRAARADALVHSPAAFRRRGIFIAPQELGVA